MTCSFTRKGGIYIPVHHPRGPGWASPRGAIGCFRTAPPEPPCGQKHRAKHPNPSKQSETRQNTTSIPPKPPNHPFPHSRVAAFPTANYVRGIRYMIGTTRHSTRNHLNPHIFLLTHPIELPPKPLHPRMYGARNRIFAAKGRHALRPLFA